MFFKVTYLKSYHDLQISGFDNEILVVDVGCWFKDRTNHTGNLMGM